MEEYRAVGSLQKAKIKAHKDKIDQMKILISQEVSKRESAIAQLKKQKMGESKGLRVKLGQLKKMQEETKLIITFSIQDRRSFGIRSKRPPQEQA